MPAKKRMIVARMKYETPFIKPLIAMRNPNMKPANRATPPSLGISFLWIFLKPGESVRPFKDVTLTTIGIAKRLIRVALKKATAGAKLLLIKLPSIGTILNHNFLKTTSPIFVSLIKNISP
jgi:hypothetical protein